MRRLLMLTLTLGAPLVFADWQLAKFAEEDPFGEWDVGCSARVSDRMTLEWTGGVYLERAQMGDDPGKPLLVIDTLVTQSKSRPIEGEAVGEVCTIDFAALDVVCEPAREEYQLRVSLIAPDAPPRHMDIWVQPAILTVAPLDEAWTDEADVDLQVIVAALLGDTFTLEFGIWGDWPDDLLEGDKTLMWRRGGKSPTLDAAPLGGEVLEFNPVSASTDLTNTAQLRRQFAACVSSHVSGGRVVSANLPRPHVRRLLERIPKLREQ